MQNVTFEMVEQARSSVGHIARRTDLLPASASVFGEAGGVWLKAESLQRTGSFKIRGAAARLSALSVAERKKGVICASAGNHAQGVALAAGELGASACVVMPEGAPLSKIEAARAYGAEVILTGASFDEAQDRALQLAAERDMTFIHAFDDPYVIAGQATVGLEILEDLPDCGTIVVPVGGGGLAAGVALAVKHKKPRVRVVGVEPENAASLYASLMAGHVVGLKRAATLADGVAVARVGELTFDLCRRLLDDIVTVGEDDIALAVLLLLERMKMVAEGAGALAMAAILRDRVGRAPGPVAAVLSGGNIDVNTLERILDKGLAHCGRRANLTVSVADRPGHLSKLLALIARHGANLLSVSHSRMAGEAAFGRMAVSLALETRGQGHIKAIQAMLEREGYLDT